MAISNRERVGRGLEHLCSGLAPFVERELQAQLGGYWFENVASRLRAGLERDAAGAIRWDTYSLLKVMIDSWHDVFKHILGHFERSLTSELLEVRNRWAHEEPFSSDDTYRVLDSAQRLLTAVSAGEAAEVVEKQKVELQRTIFAEQARSQTRSAQALAGSPKAGLRPWRDVVVPHPDVASGRFTQAEFAADLAQVYKGEGSDEYRDPVEFYRRTFVTVGLHELLVGALMRLEGVGGDPVIELQTNFGGGKTHSMLALYHLFGGSPSSDLPGLEAALAAAGLEKASQARRAVLVGTALSPGEIHKKPDGTEVRTLWGELAWQLGGQEGFRLVADSDAQGVSPGSQVLAKLFRAHAPCLVLIDEWVAYVRQTVDKHEIPSGDFEAQATFAQALTEAARAVDRTLVVASVPASRIEIGGRHGEFAAEALKNVFERVGKPWRPASADEGFEIVRRRLFEPIAEKTHFAARDAVVDGFARMYRESGADFPSECGEAAYRRKLEAAYPFQPEVFARLYDDWSTLDTFQRTRGVLRLLAKVIHRQWESQDQSLLIMPSSLPMDDSAVRTELTSYLDDVWEPILSQDVDGPDSLPLQLDRETPTLGRYSAARRVARTLFLATAAGSPGGGHAKTSQAKNPGVGDQRIRLGCTQPGETPAVFADALRRLSDRAKYIHQDGNRYWISTKPNLNRLAEDRASELLREPEVLHAEIVRRLRQDRERGDFAGVHICPETTGDVPDEMAARLVVMPPAVPHRRGQADTPALTRAKETLEARGSSPRLNRNTLVFLAPDRRALADLVDVAAHYLAWKSVCDEEEPLNLDAFQRNQATAKKSGADETTRLRIRETWIHALVPSQPDATAEIAWDEVKVTGGEPLAKRTSTKLRMDELLMPEMGGIRLRMELDRWLWKDKDKDHLSVGQLAEYFARYLYLPRITGRQALVRAIEDGLSFLTIHDTFGLAESYQESQARYLGLRLGKTLSPVIEDKTLLIKPEVAQRQSDDELTMVPGAQEEYPLPPDSSQDIAEGAPPYDGPKRQPTFFHGSVKLQDHRIGIDAGSIAEEVVQHLSTLPGAEVEVSLELQIRAPGGVQDDLIRTVTENCNTLKFESFGFEEE